jgi:hypothetical protein
VRTAAALPIPENRSQLSLQHFSAAERCLPDSAPWESRLSGISLIRALLLRLVAAAHRLCQRTLELGSAVLRAYGHTGAGQHIPCRGVRSSLFRGTNHWVPPVRAGTVRKGWKDRWTASGNLEPSDRIARVGIIPQP